MEEVLLAGAIEEGKQLLEALDKAQLQIRAAFWIYYGTTPTWKLMIGSLIAHKENSFFLSKFFITL